MTGETVLQVGAWIGGLVAMGQLGFQAYKWKTGGEERKSQAEAAKAHLDVTQAEAALPHVQESLQLGNVAEAVAVQQGMINGMQDHIRFQDEQLVAKDARIELLEKRLAERDKKIEQLEHRLDVAEANLATAKRLIGELRTTSRNEH